MRSLRVPLVLLVFALVAVAGAGCGGDDDAPSPSTDGAESATTEAEAEPEPPTKKEFIAAADKVCKQANDPKVIDDINDALGELGSATDADAQSQLARKAADGLSKLADFRDRVTAKLEGVEVSGDGGAKEFLKSRERNTQGVRDWAKALDAYAKQLSQETSDKAAAAGTKSNELAAESEKVAERYGFKECGQRSR